jgi:transcriptional regulator with XRE-family HTH domain
MARDDTFATLLRHYRDRAGLSCGECARAIAVDPSYISRIERGEREPPRRPIVERLAAALRLSESDQDRFLVSAGYAPVTVARLGHWDAALQAVTDVLTDETLSPDDRDDFRRLICLAAARWHPRPPPNGAPS